MSTLEQDQVWLEKALAADTETGAALEELWPEIQSIAEWYETEPSTINDETRAHYKAFVRECHYMARVMAERYQVQMEAVEGQPYNVPSEMFDDIEKNHRLRISVDNCNHPLMPLSDTLALRVWHDLTHYEIKSGFGFVGEYNTYVRQAEHVNGLPNAADLEHVLFCDIVGQVAWGMVHNAFPPQKVFTKLQRTHCPY